MKKVFKFLMWSASLFVGFIVLIAILAVTLGGEDSTNSSQEVISTVASEKVAEKVTEKPKEDEKSNFSLAQKNSIKHAETYLVTMPFSKSGLVKQLEFEGYSNEDASFAVENIKVDWNEQASRHAKHYLETMSFSKQALIEQLEFEGYNREQATYGAEQAGY